ncbi:MAG: hypothetical protein ACKVP5_01500 [Aestuariivirga sp.]
MAMDFDDIHAGKNILAAVLLVAGFMTGDAAAQSINDFPTVTRADYVYGCMKVNGETREALEKCSCSIDVIASLITYEQYEAAAAFMSMGQVPGERGAVFRQSEPAKLATSELQRARAEAEVRCF